MISYKEIRDELTEIVKYCSPLGGVSKRIEHLLGQVDQVCILLGGKVPNWKDMKRPILSLDFDGVINSYRSGWLGIATLPDPPVTGALTFIEDALEHFTVLIFSSRCNEPAGIAAMQNWFKEHGMPEDIIEQLIFEPGKPSWYIHIDDRAICFNGQFISPAALARHFKPWYYDIPGFRRAQDDDKTKG